VLEDGELPQDRQYRRDFRREIKDYLTESKAFQPVGGYEVLVGGPGGGAVHPLLVCARGAPAPATQQSHRGPPPQAPFLYGRTGMLVNIEGKRVSDHLDLIRGLAAIAVLVYHVRYGFFVDYGELSAPDHFSFLFYSLTAFGHDAVMVFFVLSGFFI